MINKNRKYRNKFRNDIIISAIIAGVSEFVIAGNMSLFFSYISSSNSDTQVAITSPRLDATSVLILTLLGISIFIVIFCILQKKSLDYIDDISKGISDIADGKLDTRIDIRGDDEFSIMALNVNELASNTDNLIKRERDAENTKNELIANVAHDLRTPLTSVMGYLELLTKKEDLTDEEKDRYANVAYSKAKRLEKLTEDLFGFAKIGDSRVNMKITSVDMTILLEQVMDEFYPKFKEQGLSYNLRTDADTAIINGDSELLYRLFANLFTNAIKYGADGKRIDAEIHTEESKVVISIINYGNVIPKEEISKLFDRFYRSDSSRSTAGGTGLGLSIVRNIATMHGGSVDVTSDMSGTKFIVNLPTDLDIHKEHFNNV